MATHRTVPDLETETQRRLQSLAQERHGTAQLIIREAIEEYLAREEQRMRFRDDTLAAWHVYQGTGLHLTQDEVEGWMRTVESGEDVPLPQCHL